MEPCRVYKPVVASFHPFDDEQDPDPHKSENLDPDPHGSEKLDPDPHQDDVDPQPCQYHYGRVRLEDLFSPC